MRFDKARVFGGALLLAISAVSAGAQGVLPAIRSDVPPALSGGDKLLGEYGPYRANNDLLYYHLDLRVDPAKQFLSGTNAIRFRMLEDGTRIQIDLVPTYQIEGISLELHLRTRVLRAHQLPRSPNISIT